MGITLLRGYGGLDEVIIVTIVFACQILVCMNTFKRKKKTYSFRTAPVTTTIQMSKLITGLLWPDKWCCLASVVVCNTPRRRICNITHQRAGRDGGPVEYGQIPAMSLFRSTPPGRPNKVGLKYPSARPPVRPQKVSSISTKFGM